ncbi:palmitoyltransferase ZDHHC15B isoform 2-T2 [Cochliomyia hominivorax]
MSNFERKKTTPCAGCMQAIKWVPVIFIASVIVWSYYAYVVQLCILAIENTFEKIIFLIFYHIICALFFWSYWSTVFTPVGTVPTNWRIPETEIERLFRAESQEQQKRILENFAKDLPVTNRTLNGSVRFCDKCKIIKPDRAHHCSVCGTCVLKMDHHCPWVNNCVNFTNYKYFVLFLGYALLYCLYVALTSLEYFIRFWRGELTSGMGRFHILFLFFVSLMFAISLVSLFGYHIYLVLMNRTTLEAFRAPIFRIGGPDKNGFNLGKFANFQEVFGDNWKLWFLPVYTSMGDGLQYPTLNQHHANPTSYHSMDDTRNRFEHQKPTDKLINTTATIDANLTTNNSATKTDDQQLSPVVIDMNNDNLNYGGSGGVSTPNGNVILNMDLLSSNNIVATTIDPNSNTIDNNVVEIHART